MSITRRDLLRTTGAGLLITTTQTCSPAQSRTREAVVSRLHIGADGAITLFTGKVELGQGSRAELTQAAAEELRVQPDSITLVMADTTLTPDDGGTAGSRTTPSTVPAVRRGAATARKLLLELAARRWKLSAETLTVTGGVIRGAVDHTLTYADLAKAGEVAEAFKQTIPADVTVTLAADWQVMGKSLPRPNARDLVTGSHRYPSDIERPNMLYGKVLRPPSFGATLSKIDLSKTAEMKGVVTVREGNLVACAAPTSREARLAVETLAKAAFWNQPEHPSSKDLFPLLKKNAVTDPGAERGPRVQSNGSLEDGLAAAAKKHNAAYEIAYVQHAPMEPRAAVAEWNDGSVTVWTGTQQPMRVRREVAEAFSLDEERVRVIVPDTGGGFGGKHSGETAVEAAHLARAAKRPVSLRWTREEEFTWAYFRPAALIEIQAGLDAANRISAWEFTNINSGASALQTPYEIPNTREQYQYSNSPLRQGSYRVLAATANNHARECFMDEMAAEAGQDPLDFRLAHLPEGRLRDVLEAAAKRFNWRARRQQRTANRGVGIACGTEKGSVVAACVEVEVDRAAGAIRVLHICQAFECGAIINPDNLKAQTEGCVIMTLGATLTEEIRFEGGRILNNRFSQYRVPRFRDVPELDSIFLNRPDLTSVGAGETPMIAVPPAAANAVYDACQIRLRSLPLRGSEVKA